MQPILLIHASGALRPSGWILRRAFDEELHALAQGGGGGGGGGVQEARGRRAGRSYGGAGSSSAYMERAKDSRLARPAATSAPRSLRRALLTRLVNPMSLYRRGKRI